MRLVAKQVTGIKTRKQCPRAPEKYLKYKDIKIWGTDILSICIFLILILLTHLILQKQGQLAVIIFVIFAFRKWNLFFSFSFFKFNLIKPHPVEIQLTVLTSYSMVYFTFKLWNIKNITLMHITVSVTVWRHCLPQVLKTKSETH